MKRKIIIGSRGSDLALWQANFLKNQLLSIGIDSEIKIIKTKGDKIQHISLDKMEGKGFFTKELEDALLARQIDVAVHSYKDLPTAVMPGLTIAAVSEREDPSELLLVNKDAYDVTRIFSLKENAVVGTSSPRRKSQMLSFRPDIQLQDLRGNVPTRVQKLRDKKYDAILVAYAGVNRLKIDLTGFHAEKISPVKIIPAPAQGALAYQIREEDTELKNELQKIHSSETEDIVNIERKVLQLFQGGCQVPVGVYCRKESGQYLVWAAKAGQWNEMPVRVFLKSGTKENIAEKVVEKAMDIQPQKVFITTELEEQSYFKRVLSAHGYTVHGQSLIQFSQVDFDTHIPQVDWIFFTSKNAVKYFFSRQPELPVNVRFAVMGEGTAAMLNKSGYSAHLTGFKNLSGSVLFPVAKNSLRRVQQSLSGKIRAIDWVVYENVPKTDFEIPAADILVFTSPMSVEAFFKKQVIAESQQVIAIGKTTGEELEKHGAGNYQLPYAPSEINLVDAVMS